MEACYVSQLKTRSLFGKVADCSPNGDKALSFRMQLQDHNKDVVSGLTAAMSIR